MATQRKQYSAECKVRVALEALKGLKTVNELASTYGVHPTQIAHWKHRLHKEMAEIFSVRRDKRERDHEAFQAQPTNWATQGGVGLVEKKLDLAPEAKRELYGHAILWGASDDRLVAEPRIRGES